MRTGELEFTGSIITADGEAVGDAGADLTITAGSGNVVSGDGGAVNITAGSGITASFILASQNETNYNGTGDNGTWVGGDGAGGNAYVASETITLSDGTLITVDVVDGNDDVQDFTVTSSGNTTVVLGVPLTQSSTSGTGTDFTLTPEANNITDFTNAGGDIVLTPGVGTGGGSAGAIVIPQTVAPTVTTNKLYSVSGVLTWDGIDITSAGIMTEDIDNNVLGGSEAGANLNVGFGTHNTMLGFNAGERITNGDDNVYIGYHSASGTPATGTGSGNVAVGSAAMNAAQIASAGGNTTIGRQSMDSIRDGDNNVAIGIGAGRNFRDGDDNVSIGPNSGPPSATDASDLLYIHTSQTETPLIGGNFSTGLVTFNGAVRFTERADHIGTPAATFGELWVKSDTPNVLVFTDDAGTDTVLGAGGGGTPILISDADGDTQVQVEESADEDIIRFDTGAGQTNFPAQANALIFSSAEFTLALPTANVATITGGAIDLTAGGGNTTGDGGAIDLTGGVGGTTSGGIGGAINLTGGAGGSGGGQGGGLVLTGGAGTGSASRGGDIELTAGLAYGGQTGGNVEIEAAEGGATGGGGLVSIISGQGGATSGHGGNIDITTGDSFRSGRGGNLTILAGDSGYLGGGIGGTISITAGSSSYSSYAGGIVNITGGDGGPVGYGGNVVITGGDAGVTGDLGGSVKLLAGTSTGTFAGNTIDITAGNSGTGATGNGGDVNIDAGDAASTNGSGGDINLTPGSLAGSGADGVVNIAGDLTISGKVTAATTTNTQTGTTYTAVLSDAGKMITLDNAAAITMTIPANSSVAYPIGTQLNFMQLDAGQVTVTITTDTLDVESALTLLLVGQFAVATAFKVTATTWVLFGNLEAA
jgi:hypothetical protein